MQHFKPWRCGTRGFAVLSYSWAGHRTIHGKCLAIFIRPKPALCNFNMLIMGDHDLTKGILVASSFLLLVTKDITDITSF